MYDILNNPFYCGKYEYPSKSDNWHIGKHQAMITLKEFDHIQTFLGAKGKTRLRTHSFTFRGTLRCGECGAMVTAEKQIKRQKNGNVHNYVYYHCTKKINSSCTQRYIREIELEKQINNILEKIDIPEEFSEWALNALKEDRQSDFEERRKIMRRHQCTYNMCIKKLDRLISFGSNLILKDQKLHLEIDEPLLEI